MTTTALLNGYYLGAIAQGEQNHHFFRLEGSGKVIEVISACDSIDNSSFAGGDDEVLLYEKEALPELVGGRPERIDLVTFGGDLEPRILELIPDC